jgi:hypothetical protein
MIVDYRENPDLRFGIFFNIHHAYSTGHAVVA